MAGRYLRLLDAYSPKPNEVQESDKVVDLGGFKDVAFDCRVLKPGAGNILIEHAAVNEEGAFRPLSTATWDLSQGGSFVYITQFLRFVRWRTDANVASAPVVLIDLVAKE